MAGNIYISPPQSVVNDLEAGTNSRILESIGTVFWDESHHLASSTWTSILMGMPHLCRSFALSGTAIEDKRRFSSFSQIDISDALVYSGAGNIIYEVRIDQLDEYIDRPRLMEVPYEWSKIKYGKLRNTNRWETFRNAIESNEDRKEFIASLVRGLDYLDRSTIVPVDTRKMGEELLKLYEMPDVSICWYGSDEIFNGWGEKFTPSEARSKIDSREIFHVIATSHMDESADFPSISVTILQGGKKKRRANQRSGRVARPGDKKPIVINICDDLGLLNTQAFKKRSIAVSEYFSVPPEYYMRVEDMITAIKEQDDKNDSNTRLGYCRRTTCRMMHGLSSPPTQMMRVVFLND